MPCGTPGWDGAPGWGRAGQPLATLNGAARPAGCTRHRREDAAQEIAQATAAGLAGRATGQRIAAGETTQQPAQYVAQIAACPARATGTVRNGTAQPAAAERGAQDLLEHRLIGGHVELLRWVFAQAGRPMTLSVVVSGNRMA